MAKWLFSLFSIFILLSSAQASSIINASDFAHLAPEKQREFIIRTQLIVVRMEKQQQELLKNGGDKVRKTVLWQNMERIKKQWQSILSMTAHAATTDKSCAGIDKYQPDDYTKSIPPEYRCMWNGWPSVRVWDDRGFPVCVDIGMSAFTGVLSDPAKDNLDRLNTNQPQNYPKLSAGERSAFYSEAKKLGCYYKNKTNDQACANGIRCNPDIFGVDSCTAYHRDATDEVFGAVSAESCLKDGHDKNGVQKIVDNILSLTRGEKTPAAESGANFIQLTQQIYSMCLCNDRNIMDGKRTGDTLTTWQKSWNNQMIPSMECYSYLDFSRNVMKKLRATGQDLSCWSGSLALSGYMTTPESFSLGQYADKIEDVFTDDLLKRVELAKGSTKASNGKTFATCMSTAPRADQNLEEHLKVSRLCLQDESRSAAANTILSEVELQLRDKMKDFTERENMCPLSFDALTKSGECVPEMIVAEQGSQACIGKIKPVCEGATWINYKINGGAIKVAKAGEVIDNLPAGTTVDISYLSAQNTKMASQQFVVPAVKPQAPTIKPDLETFNVGPISVTINSNNPGGLPMAKPGIGSISKIPGAIKYALGQGSEQLYRSAISLTDSITITAKEVFSPGGSVVCESTPVTKTYTFNPKSCSPTFAESKVADKLCAKKVVITCPGAKKIIIDGAEQPLEAAGYTLNITAAEDHSISFKNAQGELMKVDKDQTEIKKSFALYTLEPPKITPAAGKYLDKLDVSISGTRGVLYVKGAAQASNSFKQSITKGDDGAFTAWMQDKADDSCKSEVVSAEFVYDGPKSCKLNIATGPGANPCQFNLSGTCEGSTNIEFSKTTAQSGESVQATAFYNGRVIATGSYTMPSPSISQPTFADGGGESYFAAQGFLVNISKDAADAAAQLQYSIDNGQTWTPYTDSLNLTKTTDYSIKARTYYDDNCKSSEVSKKYMYNPKSCQLAAAPKSIAGKPCSQSVTLSCEGATQFALLESGAEKPASGSTQTEFEIVSGKKYNAYAFSPNREKGGVIESIGILEIAGSAPSLPVPVFTPESQTFSKSPLSISIGADLTGITGAQLLYRTQAAGGEEQSTDQTFTTPFNIAVSETISAWVKVDQGGGVSCQSETATAQYFYNPVVESTCTKIDFAKSEPAKGCKQNVQAQCEIGTAKLTYSIDGGDFAEYTQGQKVELKYGQSISVKIDGVDKSFDYKVDKSGLDKPVFDPQNKTFSGPLNVKIKNPNEHSTIKYKVKPKDGDEKSGEGDLMITADSKITAWAVSIDDDKCKSDEVSIDYTSTASTKTGGAPKYVPGNQLPNPYMQQTPAKTPKIYRRIN